jgi:chromate transport protein ChrA
MKAALWIIGSVLALLIIVMIYNNYKKKQLASKVIAAVTPTVTPTPSTGNTPVTVVAPLV